jgi:hypothetical protein
MVLQQQQQQQQQAAAEVPLTTAAGYQHCGDCVCKLWELQSMNIAPQLKLADM